MIAYIIPVIYVIINIAHAAWHAYRIEVKNETIQSRTKLFEYGLVSFVLFWSLLTWSDVLPLILFPLLTRMAFYDGVLNLFRKKKLLYEGEIKKKKGWVDWVEHNIGLPIWLLRIIYLLTYIGYLIYYLIVL